MLGIGYGEILVILLLALLLCKPEDLPKIAEQIGLKLGQIKRYLQVMQDDNAFK